MITDFMASARTKKATENALHRTHTKWNKAWHQLKKAKAKYVKAEEKYKKAHGAGASLHKTARALMKGR